MNKGIIFALSLSVISIVLSVASVIYFHIHFKHWPEHVYTNERLANLELVLRTQCSGSKQEACNSLKVITEHELKDMYNIPKAQK